MLYKKTSPFTTVRIENQDIAGGTPIRIILCGPANERNSNRARKTHARKARNIRGVFLVYLRSILKKEAKIRHNTITFTDEETRGIHWPYDHALVISIILANKKVYRVLIDNKSSADILYAAAFDKMDIGREKLKPICTPLIGFGGECLTPLGSIELPMTMGEPPRQVTKMVNSLIMEHLSVYNVIFGRPSLNMFRVITSTYHLMKKFPTKGRVGVLRAGQGESKRCYAMALRGRMDKHENL